MRLKLGSFIIIGLLTSQGLAFQAIDLLIQQDEMLRCEPRSSSFLRDGTHLVTANCNYFDPVTRTRSNSGLYSWSKGPQTQNYVLEDKVQLDTTVSTGSGRSHGGLSTDGDCILESDDGGLVIVGTDKLNDTEPLHAFVAKSLDHGQTWVEKARFSRDDVMNCHKDIDGNLFYFGGNNNFDEGSTAPGTSILRVSTDGGETWSIADRHEFIGDTWSWSHGLVQDSAGKYYFGIAHGGPLIQKTTVRTADCLTCPWRDFDFYRGSGGRDIAAIKGMAIFNDVIHISGYEGFTSNWGRYAIPFTRQIVLP